MEEPALKFKGIECYRMLKLKSTHPYNVYHFLVGNKLVKPPALLSPEAKAMWQELEVRKSSEKSVIFDTYALQEDAITGSVHFLIAGVNEELRKKKVANAQNLVLAAGWLTDLFGDRFANDFRVLVEFAQQVTSETSGKSFNAHQWEYFLHVWPLAKRFSASYQPVVFNFKHCSTIKCAFWVFLHMSASHSLYAGSGTEADMVDFFVAHYYGAVFPQDADSFLETQTNECPVPPENVLLEAKAPKTLESQPLSPNRARQLQLWCVHEAIRLKSRKPLGLTRPGLTNTHLWFTADTTWKSPKDWTPERVEKVEGMLLQVYGQQKVVYRATPRWSRLASFGLFSWAVLASLIWILVPICWMKSRGSPEKSSNDHLSFIRGRGSTDIDSSQSA